MQKQNADPINLQHKCSVIIKKPKYTLNDGFSWIISAIENGKLTEKSTEDDIFNLKLQLVSETEKRLQKFLQGDNKKKSVLFDPCPYCIDIPYFIIGDNLKRINWKTGNYITDNLSSSNDRILNCTVTQEINNGWTCNFTLDNTDDIYTLNNYYKLNFKQQPDYNNYFLNQEDVCVIEPNDEVEVFMSDWKGELHCVFTGFISGVNKTDDGLRKVINVSCNDVLKKLTWHYFNAQAGFDIKESRGVITSVYAENFQPLPLNKVVSTLLAETYCDIYKRDSFLLELVKIYAPVYAKLKNSTSSNSNEALKSQNVAIQSLNKKILNEIEQYIEIDIIPNNFAEIKDSNNQVSKVNTGIEEGRYARKCTIDYNKLINSQIVASEVNINNKTKKIKTPFMDYDKGELAFKIEGESQPVWEWTVNKGGYDYFFSNLKRNDEFIRNIANITQYEFFADVNGIIYFRPPNFTLPRVSILKDEINNNIVQQVTEYIKNNYWVTQDKEQYFTQFSTNINDNKIYTRVNVIGKFIETGWTNDFLKSAGYASQWWLNKYGLRMMSTVTRPGLTRPESCQTYAQMLLWKNNINYELCDTTCILNSNYTVGLPIYIEKQLAVWYIGRVTHSFNSGSGCTTNLTLTYKRTPICLKKDLDRYLTDNLNWGKLSQAEYDYIKKHDTLLTWGKLDTGTIQVVAEQVATPITEVAGNTIFKTNFKTQKLDNYDNYFIWSPIPDMLYLLTLELQHQVDIVNDVIENKKKTIINNRIKNKQNIAKTTSEIYGEKDLQGKTLVDIANEDSNMLSIDEFRKRYAYETAEQDYRNFQKEIGNFLIVKPFNAIKKLYQEKVSSSLRQFGFLIGPNYTPEQEFILNTQEARTKTALERFKKGN